jgi:hypothetical protein
VVLVQTQYETWRESDADASAATMSMKPRTATARIVADHEFCLQDAPAGLFPRTRRSKPTLEPGNGAKKSGAAVRPPKSPWGTGFHESGREIAFILTKKRSHHLLDDHFQTCLYGAPKMPQSKMPQTEQIKDVATPHATPHSSGGSQRP